MRLTINGREDDGYHIDQSYHIVAQIFDNIYQNIISS